ncbi:MAG: phosphopentomutase [bacterium]|nr:phosphopentomutase [bacterium]
MKTRVFTIILDGYGVGDLPDSRDFGDQNCNTVAHVAEAVGGLHLPALESLGLGRVQPFRGMDPATPVRACFGRMAERSLGKDSTTGHWELTGLILKRNFPYYPDGFPEEILAPLRERTGLDFIGNEAASGTEIIERLGAEHLRTGKIIIYTSADSVFQVAAHSDVLPLKELYAFCETAREMLTGEHAVSRVIARPFEGTEGAFERTPHRHDYSLLPPAATVLDRLQSAGIPVVGVGKVLDLFAGRGFTRHVVSRSNAEGMAALGDLLASGEAPGFHFVNLVDFDMLWGHRRDPEGYAAGLRTFDAWLGETFLPAMRPADTLLITADHGNDPTAPGSDHTREYVPILAYRPGMIGATDLGVRSTFADFAATVAEAFGLPAQTNGAAAAAGRSFWDQIERC